MATQPTLKVEIAFVSAPLDTAPTWVDVSAYVRLDPPVTISRGRQSELDNFDAGHCTLTLSNRDRRFDPSYSAGPYFGNLIPRKQIRVTATWSAVDYIQFQGHVVGWPQTFNAPDGKDATVSIEAFSAEAWLAENNLPNDLVYSYANTTIGSLALFLRGADMSNWNDATSNGYGASVYTGTGRTEGTLAPGMASTAVNLDGNTSWTTGTQYIAAGNWSIGFWFKTTDVRNVGSLLGGDRSDLAITASSAIDVNGKLSFTVDNGTTASVQSGVVADGIAHHAVVTASAANGLKLYIDGAGITTTSFPAGLIALYFNWIGGRTTPLTTFFGQGSLQDIAVWNKELSALEVVGFYQRSHGYLEESSATRVTRILDDVGWPAAWRSITTTQRATVGELVYNGAPAITKLQEVQRTEQGRVFASKDNKLTFLDRYYVQEQTAGKTVQQIFSDDGGATAIPYSTFDFQYVDLDVTNNVRVTTPTTWASASDATSITANGLQSKTVDTILTTFATADSMARGLVAAGKTPTYRVAPIMCYPVKNTTRWPNILGLELGHRLGIEITPMKVGSQNAQEVTLEQIEWSIGEIWSLIVAGSPCKDVWFIVDDAASLVDGTRVIGY